MNDKIVHEWITKDNIKRQLFTDGVEHWVSPHEDDCQKPAWLMAEVARLAERVKELEAENEKA